MKAHERVITDSDGTKLYGFHVEDGVGIVLGLFALLSTGNEDSASVFFQLLACAVLFAGLVIGMNREKDEF